MHESIGAHPPPPAAAASAFAAQNGSASSGPGISSASGSSAGGSSNSWQGSPKQLEHSPSDSDSDSTVHAWHVQGQSESAQSVLPSQSSSTPSAHHSSAGAQLVVSSWHDASQPSPSSVLPSSHCS